MTIHVDILRVDFLSSLREPDLYPESVYCPHDSSSSNPYWHGCRATRLFHTPDLSLDIRGR